MKKMIVGIIIGAALAFSGQAMADNLSNIGKKVDAEFPVVINGKSLNVKAISIDGTSYAPLRTIGENTGYEVSFIEKEVVFTQVPKEVNMVPETTEQQPPIPTEPEHYFTLETIEEAIRGQEGTVRVAKMWVDDAIKNGYGDAEISELNRGLTKAQEGLNRFLRIKADLEAQQ